MASRSLTTTFRDVALTGHFAGPRKGRARPAVLVIHEAGGLGEHARRKANRIADELGYAAYAMDLFGEVPASMQSAMGWVTRLLGDPAELRGRVNAALTTLAAQPEVDAGRLAAIGFCFGGTAALELARSGAELRAVVGFHAGLRGTSTSDASSIKGKVLICNGAQDPFMPLEVMATFAAEMIAANVDWQMHLYGRARHSFTNVDAASFDMDAYAYDGDADRRSWAAMAALFSDVFDEVAPASGD